MRLTRSVSLQVLRYGTRPGFEGTQLYEVGMRVDATARGHARTREDAGSLLSLLNGGLSHWLNTYWAGRLLLGPGDEAARAWAQAHARELGRAPAELPCEATEAKMAKFLLTDVCPGIFDRHAVQVLGLQLTMDPGVSYVVEQTCASGVSGGQFCTKPGSDAYSTWTQGSAKTKFTLVRKSNRASGDAS